MGKFNVEKRLSKISELNAQIEEIQKSIEPQCEKISCLQDERDEIQNELNEFSAKSIDKICGKIYHFENFKEDTYLKIIHIEKEGDFWEGYGDGYIINENSIKKVKYPAEDNINFDNYQLLDASDIDNLQEVSYEEMMEKVKEEFARIIKN